MVVDELLLTFGCVTGLYGLVALLLFISIFSTKPNGVDLPEKAGGGNAEDGGAWLLVGDDVSCR
jgi:hypothetical protein